MTKLTLDDGEYVTLQTAARLKHCSVSALYHFLNNPKNSPLIFRRMDKRIFVKLESVEHWTPQPYKHYRPENVR